MAPVRVRGRATSVVEFNTEVLIEVKKDILSDPSERYFLT
jgi:hypothetical protein